MVALTKLVAKLDDNLGYTTFVFKCLDKEIKKQSPYIMCTRFPNWVTRDVQLGEIGYLNFVEIQAGIDKWFDGQQMIPYNYDMIQFIQFVPKPKKKEFIM